MIAELGHKCLEPAATLKYKPFKQLHHCTYCLNYEDIFQCYVFETRLAIIKDDKIVKNQSGSLKVPLFDL